MQFQDKYFKEMQFQLELDQIERDRIEDRLIDRERKENNLNL